MQNKTNTDCIKVWTEKKHTVKLQTPNSLAASVYKNMQEQELRAQNEQH